jgi:hypothetical protein
MLESQLRSRKAEVSAEGRNFQAYHDFQQKDSPLTQCDDKHETEDCPYDVEEPKNKNVHLTVWICCIQLPWHHEEVREICREMAREG